MGGYLDKNLLARLQSLTERGVVGGTLLALFLMATLLSPPHADATVPGTNGKIAFASFRDGDMEIYSMNSDGTDQTNLTNSQAEDDNPAWSPDGSKVAFDRCQGLGCSSAEYDIYVMAGDGSDVTDLTNALGSDTDPTWSPGSAEIAFVGFRSGDANFQIYRMNANGTGQVNLTNDSFENIEPSWSPDGTKIAFSSFRPNNWEIVVLDLKSGFITNLSNHSAIDTSPAWSPDGTKIAFIRYDGNNPVVYYMNADGTGLTWVADHIVVDGDPAWSPDGTKITWEAESGAGVQIYVKDVGGAEETLLTTQGSNFNPDWQSIPTVPVSVSDFSFSPTSAEGSRGSMAVWTFLGPSTHTASDVSGMGLFDSGEQLPGGSYSFTFVGAGTYLYRCQIHPTLMQARVRVPMEVTPATGTLDTEFTVTWASAFAPRRYQFHVQIRRPTSPSFEDWVIASTIVSAPFVPDDGVGTYAFRARLKNTLNGRSSRWSQIFTISIST